MTTKKHYIYRARRWFEFRSVATAREFLRTVRQPDGYRHDLAPREVTPSHAAWGFLR